VKRCFGALLVAAGLAAPAAAQTDASLGIGVGTVRYPGGTSFGSAVLSPAFRFAAPKLVAEASGSEASLPGSVWASQARANIWGVVADLTDRLHFTGELTLAGTTLSSGGSTAAAHGLGELLWSSPHWGLGLGAGPSTGLITGVLPVTALHTRARAWWRPVDSVAVRDVQVILEPTHFPDGWFTDAGAGGTFERGQAVVSLWVAARFTATSGSKAGGNALVQLYVKPRVSIELGGGSYLNDPYQDLPRAGFVTLGVRLHVSPRHPLAAPPLAAAAAPGPLTPATLGDSQVVRFRMPGARALAIAGDWNAWEPVTLQSLGADVWAGALHLPPGVYHFNLVVDGSDWVVPNGVATIPDGMGGIVAVLIVR
jgi:hypothetical protein